jgi:hypothetical protein
MLKELGAKTSPNSTYYAERPKVAEYLGVEDKDMQ